MNTDNIIALFCDVDDFCLKFKPEFNKKLIKDALTVEKDTTIPVDGSIFSLR